MNMMEKSGAGGTYKPPQGSVVWYKDFFGLLNRREIDKVDTQFLRTYDIASNNEGKVTSGLKFLGLTDEDGNATDNLRKLRVVGPEFTKNLEEVVRDAYSVLLSKVECEKALGKDVINCFITEYDMAKSTAKQAAKIFVFLGKKAKIPISKELEELREPELERPKEKKRKIPKKKEEKKKGMHTITWGTDIEIHLKEGVKKTAEKAKELIDLYIKDLEETES